MGSRFWNVPVHGLRLLVAATLIAILVVGFSSVISASSTGSEDARDAFAKAQQHQSKGDVRSARIELMNAIKADPQWASARIFQAEILLELSDGIGAQAELERALELGTTPSEIRHLFGHAFQLQGKWKKAKEQLFASDIPPKNQAYAARITGRMALETGDDDLASRAFDRAITLEPGNSDLWVDIARFRAGSGDQAGAIEAVDEAFALQPENVRALQYKGELLRFQFGLGAALPWFERGLQIDPNHVPLLIEYAATLGDMGRMKDMLIVARKVVSLDSQNARAFYLQAVLAARAEKYDLARVLMQKTEGQLDDVPAVLLVQGVIEHGQGNYHAAIDRFTRLVSLQPNNRQAQNMLARSLYLAGNANEVVKTLWSQVNNSGADSYALWQVARALEALDKRQEASAILNRAAHHNIGSKKVFAPEVPIDILRAEVGREPDNARAVIPYIRALYVNGSFNEAFAHAKRLQASNPGASDAHILVADTAIARGDYEEALSALENARKMHFSEPVMLRLIDVLRAKGAMQESGEVLAQYLAYNPNNVAGLRWMAYAHLETGNWTVALGILENLRKRIGYNDALIMAGLAQAYTELGRSQKAISAGRIAYDVQPSSPVVTHLYGLALLADETRNQDAIDLLEKAVAIVPENANYRQSLANARLVVARRTNKTGS